MTYLLFACRTLGRHHVAVWRVGGHQVPPGTPAGAGPCTRCWRTVHR